MKTNYIVVGTNDLKASSNFYDSLFEETGFNQILSNDRMTYWQADETTFAVALPFDEAAATNGNGTMIGFDAGSNAGVRELYKKTIELGGSCEGEPNQSGPYYRAYVRDLDQNKICFFVVGA